MLKILMPIDREVVALTVGSIRCVCAVPDHQRPGNSSIDRRETGCTKKRPGNAERERKRWTEMK